tara:strand:- start:578 stop:1774 length:1197 start_codon:yes stop_codon:yes gene_type:complete
MKLINSSLIIVLLIITNGCASTPSAGPSYTQNEATLPAKTENPLDVSIAVFNPGIPSNPDDFKDKGIWPELRRAEAMHMANKLQEVLADSQVFGAVRVTPDLTYSADIYIKAKIEKSNGEDVAIKISVIDSTGKIIIKNKTYKHRVQEYTFLNTRNRVDEKLIVDPYQPVYVKIKNDITKKVNRIKGSKLEVIHTTTDLRFAQNFSPLAFSDILKEKKGKYSLKGRPDANDPMLNRIQAIKYRDEIFIDTMQVHYSSFSDNMVPNYVIWQEEAYEDAKNAREAAAAASRAAFGALLAGIATVAIASQCEGSSCVRDTAAIGGALTGTLAAKSSKSSAESQIHKDKLNEIGRSLETTLSPSVIEMEDTTVTLTGNANEQFSQWRAILKKIYLAETSVVM